MESLTGLDMFFISIALIIALMFFSVLLTSLICTTIRNIRIRNYSNSIIIGCVLQRKINPSNPFECTIIDEYKVIDKKWDDKGKCWVKLRRLNDKDDARWDKTKKVTELYDRGFKISYKK